MAVTHPFVSAKADDADATLVRPSDWNAAHAVFFYNEIPAGTIDGVNNIFNLSAAPVANLLFLIVNGSILREGVDYTRSGTQITITDTFNIPNTADIFFAMFMPA